MFLWWAGELAQSMRYAERVNSADKSVCGMIVTAVADAAGVAPEELSPPLYDVIAPDAIETLFTNKNGRTTATSLSFEYDEYAVTVVGEDDETIVDVQPQSTAADVVAERE